jgi:arylsulfatase A-like enzyme
MHPSVRSLACWFVAIVVGCSAPPPSRPPSIVLVTLDTTRRDHLSVYGYARPTTPHLEAFGAQSAILERAYTASSSTAPSHSTLFTGLYPLAHGVLRNGIALAPEQTTLAEILRGNGWQTAAFVSSFVLGRVFGWSQGFDVYDDGFLSEAGRKNRNDRLAVETTDRAIAWLEQRRDPKRRFFLFVHYFDPHQPYEAPAPFAGRWPPADASLPAMDSSHYDEEIAYTDEHVGRLLATLDRLALTDDTIVVVMSDHGEGLGDHHFRLHGLNVYQEAVRAPLMVRWPKQIAPRRVWEAPVEQVDVLPTVLELAGVPRPADAEWQGQSLAAALRGAAPFDADRPVFLTRRLYEANTPVWEKGKGMKLGVVYGRWKYVVGAEERTRELFDLESDPGELRNVVETEPRRATELDAMVVAWRARTVRQHAPAGRSDDETRARLRALGYVE